MDIRNKIMHTHNCSINKWVYNKNAEDGDDLLPFVPAHLSTDTGREIVTKSR